MVTTKRPYVAATFFTSGIAALVSLVALGTEQWVSGAATWTTSELLEDSYVNYGLFQGNYIHNIGIQTNYQLTMTCSFSLNVCALLCGKNAAARNDLLSSLYNNTEDDLYPNYGMEDCAAVARAYSYNIPVSVYVETTLADSSSKKSFINTGVWLCTILFLCISALSGLLASGLAIYNTITNPIEVYFSIHGLYVYNAIGFCCVLLYMILWGSMYNLVMFHDVGIFYTLAGKMNSDKRAFLGYSYWINFIPLIMYAASIAILYVREYLISKEPARKDVHLDDTADPVILLY